MPTFIKIVVSFVAYFLLSACSFAASGSAIPTAESSLNEMTFSPTITQTQTPTSTPNPTETKTSTPTPGVPDYFPGVATSDTMWDRTPKLNAEQISALKEHFRNPANQTLKPRTDLSEWERMDVFATAQTEAGDLTSMNVKGKDSILPVASYKDADGLRHMVAEVIDMDGNVQIVDLVFHNVNGVYNLDEWYKLLDSEDKLFLRVMLTYGSPPNHDTNVQKLVDNLPQDAIDAFRDNTFPNLSSSPNVTLVIMDVAFVPKLR
jgi:hypothetical protein